MKKREQGVLTVEASIVLTLFTFFVLFLLSFARIYRAQNMVGHAAMQAADAMALESYLRENALDEKAKDVVYLANQLTGSTSLTASSFESLRSANIPSIAKEKFILAVSNSETKADSILKNLGVKNGLSGIDFSSSRIDLDKDDVIVSVNYTLKMQFAVFGKREVNVTKSAKAKTFGEILFEIVTEPENPTKGSTAGGGSYQHGTKIQITAIPNYGYRFVEWNDGNRENPRLVTVTEAKKYVARFTEDSFGVNVKVNPDNNGYGNVSGGGTYLYLSSANISASPNAGYSFKNWSIYKHKDSSTTFSNQQNISQVVDQSYTFTANFEANPYTVSVESEGTNANVSVCQADNTSNSGKSIVVRYGHPVILNAPDISGYSFSGWKIKGGGIFSASHSPTVSIPANNVVYVAVYKINASIYLSGGRAGDHSTTLTAVTVPSDVTVSWKSSNPSALSVDSNGTVTANGYGSATVTASFTFDGRVYSASRSFSSEESIFVLYYCTRNKSAERLYFDYDPGTNDSDKGWQDGSAYSTVGVWYNELKVTWSQICEVEKNEKTVEPGNWLRTDMIVHHTAQSGNYAGKYNPQAGKNCSDKKGYMLYDGTYDYLFFISNCHAPKPGGGYYDYYISSMW